MHRSIYAQYSMRNFGNSDLRMVIKDQIKLVKRFNLKAKDHLVDELYDLMSDPEEKNNLVKNNDYEQKKSDLENQLLNWMKRIDDFLNSNNGGSWIEDAKNPGKPYYYDVAGRE